jgi:aquaporin Z
MASDRPKSTIQHRMLHASEIPDFLESSHEWRRLFAETWGTFLLVVVAAGAAVVGAQSGGAISLGMKVVAPGLMVMAIVYFMGAVSGAHLNPAVTLAFAMRCNFPWSRVPGYITAQIIGGVAAASFLRALFGAQGLLGATTPGPGVSSFTALAMRSGIGHADVHHGRYRPRGRRGNTHPQRRSPGDFRESRHPRR